MPSLLWPFSSGPAGNFYTGPEFTLCKPRSPDKPKRKFLIGSTATVHQVRKNRHLLAIRTCVVDLLDKVGWVFYQGFDVYARFHRAAADDRRSESVPKHGGRMPFPLSSRSFVYANCSQVGRNLKIKHWVTWKDAGRGSNSKRDKSQSRAQQVCAHTIPLAKRRQNDRTVTLLSAGACNAVTIVCSRH